MQRQFATKMRAQRAYVKGLQKGGADPDDITVAKARYLNTLHQYQVFSKKMGLPEKMERVYMDGVGRVATERKTYMGYLKKQQITSTAEKFIAGAEKSGIIKIDAVPGSAKYRRLRRDAIVKNGIEAPKPVFAADLFGELAAKVITSPEYYDVIMHGAPKSVQIFGERADVKIVAEILRGRADYDGKPIRLLSCNTGKGEACFAQMLANEMGVIVEAPNDIIWARSDRTFTIGPTKYKNTGKMIKFYPDRRKRQ